MPFLGVPRVAQNFPSVIWIYSLALMSVYRYRRMGFHHGPSPEVFHHIAPTMPIFHDFGLKFEFEG